MKANKDPKIEIKDRDRDYYHVEHTRILNPGKYPTRNVRIQIYSRKDFDATFGKKGWVEKYGLGAMNDDEVRVIHDPVLQLQLDDESVMKAEKDRLAKEKVAEATKKEAEKVEAEKKLKDDEAEKVRIIEEKELAKKKAKEKQDAEDKELQDGMIKARVEKAKATRAKNKAIKEADDEAEKQEGK